MKKNQSVSVLIAEPDLVIRKRFRKVFSNLESMMGNIFFNVASPVTAKESERIYRSLNPDIVIMDSVFMIENKGGMMKVLRNNRSKFRLFMLVSDNGGNHIKDLIQHLTRNRSLYLCGSITNGLISKELINILVRFFVLLARK